MKCKQCGSPVTLEDEFCPYCGALNIAARQHIEDMKRFNSDYTSTKSEVLGNVAKQSKRHTRIIILVILIGLNIVLLALQSQVYEIRYNINQLGNKSKAASYEAKMSELEESGKYLEMYYLYNRQDLYDTSDELNSYVTVTEMAYYYNQFKDNVYYITNDSTKSTVSLGQAIDYAASALYGFYSYYASRDESYFKERYSQKHLSAMEDMKEQIEAILTSYCSFTSDDIEKLSNIDDTDKQSLLILIGKRMGIYE